MCHWLLAYVCKLFAQGHTNTNRAAELLHEQAVAIQMQLLRNE